MKALSESRLLRLVTFTALYVAQGIPWGFAAVGLVVLLTDLGMDNTAVGVAVGLTYLPWSFKVVWGPLLDSVPQLRIGRRRPFIVFAELMMGATLIALALVDPRESLGAVTLLLLLNNTFASFQDVAVDAMAVDLLQEDERGTANSFMWAGKAGGVALGGGGGTVLAKYAGWDTLFVIMAIAVWAIMLLPLLLRERPPRPDDQRVGPGLLRLAWFLIPVGIVGSLMYGLSELESQYADASWVVLIPVAQPFVAVLGAIAGWPLVDRAGFAVLRKTFSFSVPWWGFAVGVLTPAGYAMISAVHTRMYRAELALSSEAIGTLSGVVEPIAGVAGALIGGIAADRLGVRRVIGGFMVGIAMALALWAIGWSRWSSFGFVAAWVAGYNVCVYAYNAASLGMFMTISNPRISATHFAVYMASTNLTYAWAAPLGGLIADNYGYAPLYLIAAALQIVMIVLLVPLDLQRAVRVYRA